MPDKFRFAALKRVRELQEKRHQLEMARRLRVVLEHARAIREIEEEKMRTIQDVNEDRKSGVDLKKEILVHRYLLSLAGRSTNARTQMDKARADLEKQRAVVLLAMRDRKMTDILYEKHQEAARIEEYRAEAGRLSEIAVLRHSRRTSDET